MRKGTGSLYQFKRSNHPIGFGPIWLVPLIAGGASLLYGEGLRGGVRKKRKGKTILMVRGAPKEHEGLTGNTHIPLDGVYYFPGVVNYLEDLHITWRNVMCRKHCSLHPVDEPFPVITAYQNNGKA